MKRIEAIEKVREQCRFRHYAIATENNYAHWTGRYAWATHAHDSGASIL